MNNNFYIPKEQHFKNLVQSIWQVDQCTAFAKEYIIPKGVVELIFNFSTGTAVTAQINGKVWHLGNCFINGFNSNAIQIKLPQQQVFFGVVLQPLAVKKILKVPAGEFADITVDLSLVDKTFNTLWQQLAAANDFNNRVNIFLNWMQQHLIEWQPQDALLNHFLYAAGQHEYSVKEVAGILCYSPRHLSRKITEATGMNTELLLLYKKYLHAVQLLHHTHLSLTAIAYQSNFSDQSHFIRSFKAYTNLTPGEYRHNKSLVKGHLYQDVR